ncbi:MAG TPA: sigma-70 family RNA polymerase sigma factor [Methylomirabilota bacterium]|nr:sigma-70 family RNA polymerase sigma factor [Methylomirabilota bacterium]
MATPPSPAPAPSPPSPEDRRAGFEREALVHLDSLYRLALRLSGNEADAEDLVQEAMLRAYRSWERYTPGTNAKGWLLTILRHLFINEYRRKRRHPESVDLDTIEPFALLDEKQEEDPQTAFFDRIVDEEVLRAVDQLPEAFREAVMLSDVEGLSYEEIAKVLEVPVGTVKSRLYRGRRLLQGKLHEYAVSMGYIKGHST